MKTNVEVRTRAMRGTLWRMSDVLPSLLLGTILGCGLMSCYCLAFDRMGALAAA